LLPRLADRWHIQFNVLLLFPLELRLFLSDCEHPGVSRDEVEGSFLGQGVRVRELVGSVPSHDGLDGVLLLDNWLADVDLEQPSLHQFPLIDVHTVHSDHLNSSETRPDSNGDLR